MKLNLFGCFQSWNTYFTNVSGKTFENWVNLKVKNPFRSIFWRKKSSGLQTFANNESKHYISQRKQYRKSMNLYFTLEQRKRKINQLQWSLHRKYKGLKVIKITINKMTFQQRWYVGKYFYRWSMVLRHSRFDFFELATDSKQEQNNNFTNLFK